MSSWALRRLVIGIKARVVWPGGDQGTDHAVRLKAAAAGAGTDGFPLT
jgi:hypothetical protein